MEELLAVLIGAGVVSLMPLVPALRPVVKTVVKGGLVVTGATKATTDAIGQHWREVVSQAKQETTAGGEVSQPTSSTVEATS